MKVVLGSENDTFCGIKFEYENNTFYGTEWGSICLQGSAEVGVTLTLSLVLAYFFFSLKNLKELAPFVLEKKYVLLFFKVLFFSKISCNNFTQLTGTTHRIIHEKQLRFFSITKQRQISTVPEQQQKSRHLEYRKSEKKMQL